MKNRRKLHQKGRNGAPGMVIEISDFTPSGPCRQQRKTGKVGARKNDDIAHSLLVARARRLNKNGGMKRAVAFLTECWETVTREWRLKMQRFGWFGMVFLMLTLSGLGPGAMAARAATSGDYTYSYTSGGTTCTITAYSGSGGAVEIPATLDGYTVTAIGVSAFASNTALTGITFASGSSVTSIGVSAFSGCSALESIDLSNVTSLGAYAFHGCSKLTTVTALSSGLTTIGVQTFYGCSALTSINLSNVTSLGESAFYNCSSLTTVTALSSGLTTIGAAAFDGCSALESIDLSSVTSLGASAFFNCSNLTTVTALSSGLTTLNSQTFYKCSSLTSIDLSNVTSIGTYALYGCSKLTTVTALSSGLTTLNNYTFYGCSSLTGIDLNNVTSIGSNVFYNCTALTSIDLSNVTSLGERAFLGCEKLTSVTISSGLTTINDYTFDNCYALTSIDLSHVTTIGYEAFWRCTSLTSIDLSSAESLGTYAFYSCSKLTSVNNLSSKLTTLNSAVFGYCTSLTSIDLSHVTTIGSDAFSTCASLASVDLSGVESIGSSAFSSCYKLTSLDFSNVTTIGASAFYGCSGLTTVDLSGVDSIGDYAFQSCSKLVKAYFDGAVPGTLGSDIFSGTVSGFAVYCIKSYQSYFNSSTLGSSYSIKLYKLPVTYDGNGNDGGAVPVDSSLYDQGTAVTVLDNTGSLTKSGYSFNGWNTSATASTTPAYNAGGTLTITDVTTLYANWLSILPTFSSVTPTTLKTGTAIAVTSNDDGTVYLVSEGSYTDEDDLKAATTKVTVTVTAGTAATVATSGLAEGTYYLYVVNSSGTLSDPVTITIDNTAPTLSGVSPTSLLAGTAISAISSEVGTVYLVASGSYSTESALAAEQIATATVTTAGTAISLATTGLADGTYQVYAVDSAGNISAATTVTIDTTGPTVSVCPTILKAGTAISVTSSEVGTVYLVTSGSYSSEYSLAAAEVATAAVGTAGTTVSLTTTGLTEGTYQIYAVDSLGNMTAASATITIDNTAPTLSGVSPTSLAAGTTISAISSEVGTVYLVASGSYSDESALATAQVATATVTTAGTAVSLATTGVADGTYQVYAVDNAGNLSAATLVTIDTTGPTVNATPTTLQAGTTISVTSSEIGTVYLVPSGTYSSQAALVTAQVATATVSTAGQTVSLTTTGLTDGTYQVYAVDCLGNLATAATAITIDNTAPTVSSVTVTSGTYSIGDQVTLTVNYSETVTVDTSAGTPYLPITLDTGGMVNATYVSGSGTTELVFEYTVTAGVYDTDGITVGSAITANGGSLTDSVGNAADLTLNNVADTSQVLVLTTVVSADSVSDIAIAGNVLTFTLDSIYYDYIQILTNGTLYQTIGNDDTDTEIASVGQSVNLTTESGAYSVVIRVYDLVGNYRDFSTVYKVRVKYVPGKGDGFGWEMWKD